MSAALLKRPTAPIAGAVSHATGRGIRSTSITITDLL